jgi:hypothetical protein
MGAAHTSWVRMNSMTCWVLSLRLSNGMEDPGG